MADLMMVRKTVWPRVLGMALALGASVSAAYAQATAVEVAISQPNQESACAGAGQTAPEAADPPVATAAPEPQIEQLTPFLIDKQLLPAKLDVKDLELPTNKEELIRYLAEGYFPQETELTIDEAVAIALEHNHDLNSKRLSAAAACQGIAVDWAALDPQLSLQAKTSRQENNSDSATAGGSSQSSGRSRTASSLALTLTQRIYDWGLTHNQIDVSRAQFAIQNYTVDMAEQQLVADVITSYYEFSAALGQVRIRDDGLALAKGFLSQAQLRLRVGTVPRLDVIRAEARVEQARADLVAALAALGDAAASFYALLGVEDQRYIPAVITVSLIETGAEPPATDVAAKTAVATRPELLLQYAALAAGEGNVELTRNRPVLQAYANSQLQDPSIQSGSASVELGLQLNWSLYTGGADKSARLQAQTELKALQEGLHELEAQIELDATKSWDRLYSARTSVQSAQKNLELTAEALRIASLGYAAGVVTFIDYRDALDANVAAALDYLTSLIEVRQAQVDLERAQGFPAGYPGDPRAGRNGSGTVQDVVLGAGQDLTAQPAKEGSDEK